MKSCTTVALISTCIGLSSAIPEPEVNQRCGGWDLYLQQGIEEQPHSHPSCSSESIPSLVSHPELPRLVGAAAAQAEIMGSSKTWFQWTEEGWKKKPRERARARTHHLTVFWPSYPCSPPVLPCAGLCFCSAPPTSLKPSWISSQGAFFPRV